MIIFIRKLNTAINNPLYAAHKISMVILYLFLDRLFIFEQFHKRRDDFLGKWQLTSRMSKYQRYIFRVIFEHWIDRVYLREADPDRRVALSLLCMGGESGVAWADMYAAKPVDRTEIYNGISFDDLLPAFPALERVLEDAVANTVVVQIGASSGREMFYFAQKFKDVLFIGTDIDDSILDRARATYICQNLKFSRAFAHSIIEDVNVDVKSKLILFSSGSLQYVQPEHMEVFFKNLKIRGNLELILNENAREDDLPIDEIKGSRWRGNFSYTHDYKFYAEKSGLTTIDFKSIVTCNDKRSIHYKTRHYFYHCRS